MKISNRRFPRWNRAIGVSLALLVACGGLVRADEPTPSSPAAAWGSIDKNLQQLEALIKAGKIGDLGSSAYGIANAFKTLPPVSTALPADQLATIKHDVSLVGSEVSKLDKAGEHGDAAGVQSHLQALKSVLDGARKVYAH